MFCTSSELQTPFLFLILSTEHVHSISLPTFPLET